MVTGLIGFTSIQAHIYTLKLLFLQSLGKLRPDDQANKLFNLILLQFKTTRTNHMIGFIPDVHRVHSKYALTPYTGVFPELYGNVSSKVESCTKKNSLRLNDLKADVTSTDFTKYIPL